MLIENGIWIVLVRYWIRLSKIQRIIIIVLLSEIVKKPLKWQKMYGKCEFENLQEYILPTRGRADIILHKTENHIIDSIFMRKY